MANYQLIGTVMNDPEVRYTPNGTAVANFRMAVNPDRNNKDKKFFVKCVAWKDDAALVGDGISAKDFIGVNGRITDVETWVRDGVARGQVVVTISEIAKYDRDSRGFVALDGESSTRQTRKPAELPPVDDDEGIPF